MNRIVEPLRRTTVDLVSEVGEPAAVPLRAEPCWMPVVPNGEWQRRGLVAHDIRHPAAMTFDILRTRTLQTMRQRGWRTVGVSAPARGPGKSLVAANLALALARHTDFSTLLVDLDWRQPALAARFGIDGECGWNQVLENDGDLAQALIPTALPRLTLLPCGVPMAAPAERLATRRTAVLLDELRERYPDRLVVFDLPPLLGVDDALAVLPAMECTLLVVDDGTTRRREVKEALRQLPPEKFLGAVLAQGGLPRRLAHPPTGPDAVRDPVRRRQQ